MQSRILIVDDEAAICSMLMRDFRASGLASEFSTDPEAGLERLKDQSFDLVITDLRMPGIDGLEFLRRAKRIRPNCEVVLMTGHATVATAREALTQGAVDYLTKPFSVSRELRPLIRRVLDAHSSDVAEEAEEGTPTCVELSSLPTTDDGLEGIVAHGDAMMKAIERARRVAQSDASVLLQGESGTGKEVIASLIQRLSPRRDHPFVKINCAALCEDLLESELFGYAKGAFTGATRSRVGLFEVADGGTLLLDEVGEISLNFQPKLLRVLQEGEFYPVGDPRAAVKVDVRIIAATNRNLAAAVASGNFRRDLYYRLNVVSIEVPPLREHLEDLVPLVNRFISLLDKGREMEFSVEAMDLLKRYGWPGNVRELANAVEYVLVMTEGARVGIDDLPVAIQDFRQMQASAAPTEKDDLGTLEEIEKRSILHAMVKQDFNRTQAARLLGVTRRTLGYRIAKYGMEDELARLRLAPQPAMRPGLAKVQPAGRVSSRVAGPARRA